MALVSSCEGKWVGFHVFLEKLKMWLTTGYYHMTEALSYQNQQRKKHLFEAIKSALTWSIDLRKIIQQTEYRKEIAEYR